ncbi:MAG: cytochrome c biogenesis heme-transporting ATPase CcmA [Woeseiaceae bacterium]|nr:cytochrome c biogenesis heme-transporting ATPase CcmA [Woeseiaceae bacterium]
MTALLIADDLSIVRGDRCLFERLEFALNPGEALLVEGANGSGKTSLLRGIAGLLEFYSGKVVWNGANVRDDYQLFRADLGWLSHRVGFKGELNVLENLRFDCAMRSAAVTSQHAVIERLGLASLTGLPFRYLSAGQQRRVALARLLLSNARLWLMDEPTTNLDKAGRSLVATLIDEHLQAGGLCVVASHQPVEVAARTYRVTLG